MPKGVYRHKYKFKNRDYVTQFPEGAVENLHALLSAFADLNGYKLNPDTRRVDMVIRGLLGREERYGEFLCPCRSITGDQVVDSTIVCPCVFMHDDLWFYGYCHCKLFFRSDFEGSWITSGMASKVGKKRKKKE